MGELGLLLLNESSWGASDAWGGGGGETMDGLSTTTYSYYAVGAN